MKKILILLSVLLALCMIFVSCGDNGDENQNENGNENGGENNGETGGENNGESSGEGENTVAYTVTVVFDGEDEDTPAVGLVVKVYNDTVDVTATTDENGVATFTLEKARYTIELESIPSGYTLDEYAFTTKKHSVTMKLQALGTETNPIEVYRDENQELSIVAPAQSLLYYRVMGIIGVDVTINDEGVYVIYNGETYENEGEGIVIRPTRPENSYDNSVILAIGNTTDSDITIAPQITLIPGSNECPHQLSELGALSILLPQSEQMSSVYYEYTATANGELYFELESVTEGANIDVYLYNINTSAQRELSADDDNVVSIVVQAGDVVKIWTHTLPNDDSEYPSFDVSIEASLYLMEAE